MYASCSLSLTLTHSLTHSSFSLSLSLTHTPLPFFHPLSPSPLSLSPSLPSPPPPQWKTRYVVFKISGGGRLQFIIYKESPTSPANEVKEIPIEEYGGLESNTKVDSEKNVFSVITTNMTDTFATESGEDLMEWTQLLQEYLGKGVCGESEGERVRERGEDGETGEEGGIERGRGREKGVREGECVYFSYTISSGTCNTHVRTCI